MAIESTPAAAPQDILPTIRSAAQICSANGNKHVCFGIQSVAAAERELRSKRVDIVVVGGLKDMAPNIFLRANSGNLIEFIEQPDPWW
jgi:hypothetical protein